MSDLKIQGEVSLDTTKADAAFAKVEQGAGKMARGVEASVANTGKAVEKIGNGGDGAATKIDRSTKSIISSIQRTTAAMEAGEKGSSKYYEAIAKQRGVSVDALKPYLAQLDAAKAKQDAATGSMGKFGTAAEQARATILSLGVAMAGAFSARAFVQTADAVTQLQNQLKLATGGAEAAGVAYEALFQIAQRSRVSFTELGSTFASISRASDQLGLSQKQLLTLTETIGNAVTVGGSSAQASSAALMQLSQGLASGVLRGEELNSIMEQTPRLARALADGLNVPIGKLREMGKEGELTAEKVINALQSQSRVLAGEVQDSVLTLGQAFTQLGNSATMLVGEVDRVGGATSSMASEIQAASSSLDDISRAFKGAPSAGQQTAIFGDAIATVFETVAVLGVNLAYVLNQVVDTLGGLAAKAAAIATFNLEANRAIGKEMAANSRQAREEVDALTSRILNARRLNAVAASSSGLDTRAEDARLSRYGEQVTAINKVTAAATGGAKAVKSMSDAFAADRQVAKEWASYMEKFTKAASDAESESLNLTNSQKTLIEYLSSPAYLQADAPMRELALQTAYAAVAAEQNAEAMDLQAKSMAAIAKAEDDRINALNRSASSVQQQVQDLMDEERAAAIAAVTHTTLAQAVQEVAIARLQDQQAMKMQQGDRDAEVLALQTEIDARRELIGVLGQQEQRNAAKTGAENAAKEWKETATSIENTLTQALMDGFENGESFGQNFADSIVNTFKTYVAKEIAASLAKALISGMSGLSGISLNSGSGGGTSWVDMAQKAYGAYSQAGTAAATGTAAASSYGGSYAAGSVPQSVGYAVPASSTAASTGVANSTLTTGGYTAYGYLGYAALIAAAVMIAENLYEKGYNRAAVGYGSNDKYSVGMYSSYTADNSLGQSAAYDYSEANLNRQLGDALGLSEKWVDILSGTTRMGTLFGRKLKDYGMQANVGGGEVNSVDGYAYYKGGLFRSNKTKSFDLDERDSSAFQKEVDSWIVANKAMASAMGLSEEALNSYSGSVKINFKNAETATEIAERYAEAQEKLQFEMLKAASGSELTKEAFEDMMAGIQASIESAGISTEGITASLAQGAIGRMDASGVGEALSESIIGGIYNTIASNTMAPVAELFMQSIITPIFTAIASGVPISQAISQQAITSMVASAQEAAARLNAIFSDKSFLAAIAGIQNAISSISSISTQPAANVAAFGAAASAASLAAKNAAAQAAAAAKAIKDSWASITDTILDEMKRLRGEIVGDGEDGQAYAQAQFTIATAQARSGNQDAADSLAGLSQALIEAAESNASSLIELRLVQGATLQSLAETRTLLGKKYGISLPAFDVGTNYVPKDMIAQIHEGEAIIPKAYNPAAMPNGGGSSDVVAELRAVRQELAELRSAANRNAESSETISTNVNDLVKGRTSIRTRTA